MSSKRIGNLDGIVVTAKVIGQIIGVSDRQVRNLAAEGVIPKLDNGSYSLVDALNTYIRHIKVSNDAAKQEITGDYNTEKTLHEKAKREKAELQLAEMRGEIHNAEDVKSVMTEMLSNLRSKLLAIPTKAAPVLVARNEIATIEGILRDSIFETLQELSDYSPGMYRSNKYVDLGEDEVVEVVEVVEEDE